MPCSDELMGTWTGMKKTMRGVLWCLSCVLASKQLSTPGPVFPREQSEGTEATCDFPWRDLRLLTMAPCKVLDPESWHK